MREEQKPLGRLKTQWLIASSWHIKFSDTFTKLMLRTGPLEAI